MGSLLNRCIGYSCPLDGTVEPRFPGRAANSVFTSQMDRSKRLQKTKMKVSKNTYSLESLQLQSLQEVPTHHTHGCECGEWA